MLSLANIVVIALLLQLISIMTSAVPLRDNSAGDEDDSVSRLQRGTPIGLDFLLKYGYLQSFPDNGDEFLSDETLSDETVTNAIKMFQKFTGLKVTGILDKATMMKMKAPRCGTPDVILSDSSTTNNGNMPHAYTAMGSRWSKNTLTWMSTQPSAKLRQSDQLSAIQKALAIWSEVTPLSFQYSPRQPDIEIKFVSGEHGDGVGNGFDGKGGVLAHAFRPGNGLGGDTHFDEDESWSMGTGVGVDLTTVAAHEFGHALGLAHSGVPGALMAPYYTYNDQLSLKDDDIRGIQSIYGSKPATTRFITPPATSPTIPTTRTTTGSSTKPRNPDFCNANFQLDAISQGPDGFVYAFRDDIVYKFNGQGLEMGFPKLISHVFQQAPRSSVNAVTFIPETRKTYIFKEHQVWRYTDFDLDEGYPKIWTDSNNLILSAALTLTYRGRSQIFLFGNNIFWEWNPQTENIVPGYPLMMQTYFPHAPNLPDAAFMNQQGHFFFFKGNSYKKLENRGRDAGLKTIGPHLFGSVCGGQSELLRQLNLGSYDDQVFYDLEHYEFPQPEFSPMIWRLINRTNN